VIFPLRLLVQPADAALIVQDAEGATVYHAAKQPDPATPKEDLIVVAADAGHSRPLYTMTRAFPKWFHIHDAEGQELCMIHERPTKDAPWVMDIYDVGDPILQIGKDTAGASRSGGLGGLFKGLVARGGAPSGYQVTTPDATPVLRLHPDTAPDQYVIERLGTVPDLTERRALISLLGVVLHPLARRR